MLSPSVKVYVSMLKSELGLSFSDIVNIFPNTLPFTESQSVSFDVKHELFEFSRTYVPSDSPAKVRH